MPRKYSREIVRRQYGLELLTSTQTAKHLGICPTAVRKYADKGLLPCIRYMQRGPRFFKAADVQKFLEQSYGQAAE